MKLKPLKNKNKMGKRGEREGRKKSETGFLEEVDRIQILAAFRRDMAACRKVSLVFRLESQKKNALKSTATSTQGYLPRRLGYGTTASLRDFSSMRRGCLHNDD
jgi:hypothetical protein